MTIMKCTLAAQSVALALLLTACQACASTPGAAETSPQRDTATRTAESAELAPLATATPTGALPPTSPSPAPTATMTPTPQATATATATPSPTMSATVTRTAGIPWAGKVTPGQPVPDEVIQSITASWDEMYRALYDYQSVKANGQPSDQAWWTEQVKRFFIGAAMADWQTSVEDWFKSGATGGPGCIENGRYTLTVKQCTSDTECVLEINVQSGQWWAYDVAEKQFSKANVVKPFQWRVVMQYDVASGQWKFKS